MEKLVQGDSSKYIPKCIKDLESIGKVSKMLEGCIGSLGDPQDYCNNGPHTDISTDEITTKVNN